MTFRYVSSLALTLILSGCATIVLEDRLESLRPLQDALTASPDSLRDRAERGDANAQFSYSIVLSFGLNGAAADQAAAADYRDMALAPRGTKTTNIYVAGNKKQPGHMQTVGVPNRIVEAEQAGEIDACIYTLKGSDNRRGEETASSNSCGSPENFQRLLQLWQKARK